MLGEHHEARPDRVDRHRARGAAPRSRWRPPSPAAARRSGARPVLSIMQCTTSPLGHDGGSLDAGLVAAEAGLPVGYMTMASCAFTGPATLAGSLVVGNAEVIAALALMELAAPGCPVYYAAAQTAMDLRSGAYTGGGPEDFLFGAATNQLADFYRVPLSMGAFATGAKAPDWQAGVENSLVDASWPRPPARTCSSASGSSTGAGSSPTSSSSSTPRSSRSSGPRCAGIPVDDESLALETIRRRRPRRRLPDRAPHAPPHARAVEAAPHGPPPDGAWEAERRGRPRLGARAGARAPGDPPSPSRSSRASRPSSAGSWRRAGPAASRGAGVSGRPRRFARRSRLLEPALVERSSTRPTRSSSSRASRSTTRRRAASSPRPALPVEGGVARIPQAVVEAALATVPRSFDAVRPGRQRRRPLRRRRRPLRPGLVRGQRAGPGHARAPPVALRRPRPARPGRRDRCPPTRPSRRPSSAATCRPRSATVYRLFLVLLDSDKPVVTGAFSARTDGRR